MKKAVLALMTIAMTAAVVLAQAEQTEPAPEGRRWGMGNWGWGTWGCWVWGIVIFFFGALLFWLAFGYTRGRGGGGMGEPPMEGPTGTGGPEAPPPPPAEPQETELDILKKRYAKGEITKEEFEQMKRDLRS